MASSFIVADNGSFTVTPVTGTDVAGNSFTIDAGQGTGSGAGGSLTFRTAKAGGTGTGANTYTDRLSINEDGVVDVKTTLAIGGTSVTATATELNILDGVTATAAELNLLDGSTAGGINASKAVVYGSLGELNAGVLQIGSAIVTATAAELNILDGVTATTAQLNYVAGVTAGTAAASKALVLDAQSDISGINNIETATATFTGGLDVKNGATSGGVINLFEDSDNGTNKITLKAADAIAADFTLTLPNADGGANQFLQTDGSGNLSFADPTAGAIGIDDLSDAKAGGTDFSNSIILGHETTGTLAAASNNTAFGIGVIDAITSGTDNVAVGYNAGTELKSGANNTLVGSTAGIAIVSGTDNTLVGSTAGDAVNRKPKYDCGLWCWQFWHQ
jgi:hypothetical protein